MGELFAYTHSVPKIAKTKPIAIEVIDGRPLLFGAITEGMIPLELIVGSNRETIALDIISSPWHPIILKLSWLEMYNPVME